jgi:Spy/CpxP family protein refolding chaperone
MARRQRERKQAVRTDLDDVRDALDERMAAHRRSLEALVRMPSVSAPGFDEREVRRSA